jgi:hypothetical protein
MKTIEDFDKANIEKLRDKFNYGAIKDGFNLTEHLDNQSELNFNQEIINEIVLWKVNRYVSIQESAWFKDFNDLKDIISIESNEEKIKIILEKMLRTHGIRLPMASTFLRFRNPKVFQIIDARTFRVIFGDNEEKKKKYDANNEIDRIEVYFDYLIELRKECVRKSIEFFEADRILYQFDIDENKNFTQSKKA